MRLKPCFSAVKNQVTGWVLFWAFLCSLIVPVSGNEADAEDLKVVAYIRCAVDFDMFGKILRDTPEEDKIRIFGEGIVTLEKKSITFFKNGSDFFVIQAVKLSSREHVSTVARQRFERITAGFESNHQQQLDQIITNGYRCVELLGLELESIRNEAKVD